MNSYDLTKFLTKFKDEHTLFTPDKIDRSYRALSSALVHLLEEKSEEKITQYMLQALSIISYCLTTDTLTLNTLNIDDIDTLLINIDKNYADYLEKVNINTLFVCMAYAVTLFDKINENCLKKILNLNQ